jgi:short-subunit dehydrogenase
MNLIITARRADRLEQLADQITATGARCIPVTGDISDQPHVNAAVTAATENFGRLDAVLANAGYAVQGNVADLDENAIRAIFEVNFFGTLNVIRAAAPVFRAQRAGHILITSSCLSRFTLPYYSPYTATKAAQTQVARSLRLELQPDNVDVSVIHPITTITEFFEVAATLSGSTDVRRPNHAPGMFVQTPERVAKAIVKCLRRPKAEVWTSHIVRLNAGLMVAFPRFHDYCARFADRDRANRESTQE